MYKDDNKNDFDKLNSIEVIEQTFLSWVQTGLTLIGIGFGVGSVLAAMKVHHFQKNMIKTIKVVGLLLILVGFVSIVLSLVQHRNKLNKIKGEKSRNKYLHNLPSLIGMMIAFLGLIAFMVILIHIIL